MQQKKLYYTGTTHARGPRPAFLEVPFLEGPLKSNALTATANFPTTTAATATEQQEY
jgi:hypothetical protein